MKLLLHTNRVYSPINMGNIYLHSFFLKQSVNFIFFYKSVRLAADEGDPSVIKSNWKSGKNLISHQLCVM